MNQWCCLSILTDEVSQDLDTVLRFARDFRLDGVEIRSVGGKAFRDLTTAELQDIAKRSKDAGLAISACATPVFKCPLDSQAEIKAHVELFRRSVEAAHILGCQIIRVFTFLRQSNPASNSDLRWAADHFVPLLAEAAKAGVLVGVENEASCLVATGEEVDRFFKALPESSVATLVWDPCNVLYVDGTTDPVSDDYQIVAKYVGHVHLKDARRDGARAADRCVCLGEGAIDVPAQLRLLKARDYQGWITLETHWRSVPLDAESQHLPAGYAFSQHAEPASRICMAQLRQWIEST